MIMSKLRKEALQLYYNGQNNITEISRQLKVKHELPREIEYYRKSFSKYINRHKNFQGPINIAENEMQVDFSSVDHGWLKTKSGSFHFKNNEDIISYEEMKEDLVEELKNYAPVYPKIKREKLPESNAIFIGLSDIHLGSMQDALGGLDAYDTNEAIRRCKTGVEGLIQKSSGFNIDKIILQVSGDAFHAEGVTMKTTKGTGPFYLSEPYWKTYQLGKRLYIDLIEMLLQVAPVELVEVIGNHDQFSGHVLMDTLVSWFRNCDDVTDISGVEHRKYTRYHNNLIMISHGDGGRESNLPLTMAHEEPKLWGECKHKWVFLGHKHHKIAKDYMGVSVEYLRTPKPSSDYWHHKNQFHHAPQAIEAFIFDKENGQVARLTHSF